MTAAVELRARPALAVPPRAPEPPPIDDVERELASLRPETAAAVRQLLAHRGKLAKLVEATGRPTTFWYGLSGRMVTGERWAIVRALDMRHDGVGSLDVIPCTKCGLRGHVAGDPDRCLVSRDPRAGMGQSPWMGGDGGL